MEDETIQQDVSAEAHVTETAQAETQNDGPAVEDPRSRRERRMAEVAQKRQEQREAERKAAALMNNPDLTEEEFDAQQVAPAAGDEGLGDFPADSEGGEHGEGEETRAEEQPGAADDQRDADADRAPANIPAGFEDRGDGTPVKKLKVNGRIVELTMEEYERHLSKDLAGDQKLRMAAEHEQRLRQREEELARREQSMRQQPPEPGADAVDIEQALSEYHDAVYAGDADAAKAKLKAVIEQGRQSSTPNIDQLVSQAATRAREEIAAERHREAVQTGWKKFQQEYPEIVTHKGKLAYADTVIHEVNQEWQEEGKTFTADELILEAGRRTAEAFGTPSQPAPRTDAERVSRKANLKPVPRAGSAVARPTAKPQLDMSPAAKIARLRQSRAV
jgi:hypothetical protein